MSVAIRRAIYGKLAGDVTLTGQLASPVGAPNTPASRGYGKAIFYEQAPEGARYPYIIFAKQAGTPRYAIGARAYDNEVWLVKAIDGPDASPDGADAIASRLDELLTDATLSISGRTQQLLRRESDVDYAETVDGETYRHAGANFRLIYE